MKIRLSNRIIALCLWVVFGWFGFRTRISTNMEEFLLLNTEQLVPALAFMTFAIVIVYALVHFFRTSKTEGEHRHSPLTRASEQKRAREGSIIKK